MNDFQNFVKDFNSIERIIIFEVAVIDKRTGRKDYIAFDITINEADKTFVAQRIGFNEDEERSNNIAFTESAIDADFSIDENLQELYAECINDVMSSEFFTLLNQ